MISSDHGGSVLPGPTNAYDAIQRLYLAGDMPTGSKIIVFGFGLTGTYPDMEDLIHFGYYNRGFAFFSPAGSASSALPVVFPATMPEVFAATARTSVATPHPLAHTGPAVDGIAFAPVFVSGPNGSQSSLDVSSAATAQIGGVAALVLQKFPSLSNLQLYNRLKATTREFCGPSYGGVNGIINAEAAVGGLCVPSAQFAPVTYEFVPGGATSYTHQYCFQYSGGVYPVAVTTHPSGANITGPHCGSITFGPGSSGVSYTIPIQFTVSDNYAPGNPPIQYTRLITVTTSTCPWWNPFCF